jgi:hypothetical protein
MALVFDTVSMPAMSLAMAWGRDGQKTIDALKAFRAQHNVGDEKWYFSQMTARQHDVVTSTFIKFVTIPLGTKGTDGITIIDLPAMSYACMHLTEGEFQKLAEGGYQDDFKAYDRTPGVRRMDITKILPFAEKVINGATTVFNVYIPLK